MRTIVLLFAFALALGACSDLPDLGTCGNGIIEAELGEACDGDLPGADTCTDTCELACQTSPVTDAYVVVASTSTSTAEQYCPDARLTCGLDGICRGASGQFASPSAAQPFNAKLAVAGDFDGDDIADLIGTSATEIVVRLGAATAFTDGFTQAAPSSDSPLAIFDKTTADAFGLGIAVPTDGLALLTYDGEVFGPDLDLAFPLNDGNQVPFIVTDPDLALERSQVVMAVSRTSPLVVQRIGLSGAHTQATFPPCGPPNGVRLVTVAVSRDRRSFVVVGRANVGLGFFLCHYTPVGATFQVATTAFNNEVAPDEAAFAQLDDDPCPDLAFTRLAPPVGTSSVIAAMAAPNTCTFGTTLTILGDLGETDSLLATGSIVPRGTTPERDELVLDSGVYQVEAGQLTRVIGPTSDINPWNAAAVVDLNGDGQLDVVAGRRGQDDVDVVRGGASPNVYRADTTAPVSAITAGDFDGDRVGDVALTETNGMADQRISILYGARDGIVGTPVVTSKFDGTLRTARLERATWSGTSHGTDGVDDLIVVRVLGAAATGGLLVGDPARIMTVPRLPPIVLTPGVPPPSIGAVTVGTFDPTSPRVLAATLRPDPANASTTLISTNDIVTQLWEGPVIVSGFAIDTLRAPTLVHTTAGGMVGAFTKPGQDGRSEVGLVGLDGGSCKHDFEGAPTSIRAADLVGEDGVDELIVSTPAAGRTQVFPVVGGAACKVEEPILTTALVGCADVANVGDQLIALCAVGPQRSGVFRIDADGTREPDPTVTVDGVGLELVVGDFDGDGVRDVAVVVGRAATISVQFLKQCPAHDTRGCQ